MLKRQVTELKDVLDNPPRLPGERPLRVAVTDTSFESKRSRTALIGNPWQNANDRTDP